MTPALHRARRARATVTTGWEWGTLLACGRLKERKGKDRDFFMTNVEFEARPTGQGTPSLQHGKRGSILSSRFRVGGALFPDRANNYIANVLATFEVSFVFLCGAGDASDTKRLT